MTEHIALYCVFPDEATALQVAQALTGDPNIIALPPDGWFNGVYYNIDVLFGTGHVWIEGVQQPGYHINGLWNGPEESIPAALAQFRVYPETPVCVFG